MGILNSSMQAIMDKVESCFKAARRVDPDILNWNIKSSVFECFSYLTPLSTRLKRLDLGGPSEKTLLICKWIRYKDLWKGPKTITDEEQFFDVIVEHGERIKPLVREGISKEFSSLVDLTHKFKIHKPMTIKMDIPPTTIYKYYIDPRGSVHFTSVASSILLNTEHPLCVELFDNEGSSICCGELDRLSMILAVEDAIDYIIQLYERAEAEIAETVEYNRKIIEEMRRIVSPLIVASVLHR